MKMVPSSVADLVNKIEIVLKKCNVISSSFDDIEKGIVSQKRKRIIYIVNCFTVMVCILSGIWSIAPLDSPFYLNIPNPYYAYGRLGRFISAVNFAAFTLVTLYSLNILMNETKGSLTPVTNLKHLFDKLPHPSDHEVKKLTFLLRILPYIRLTNLMCTLPVFSFVFIGSVVTSYELQSLTFLLASIPEWFVEGASLIHASHTFTAIHVLIAQSARYLLIRLDRVDNSLSALLSSSKMQVKERVDIFGKTRRALIDLDSILDEVLDHNRCIKYWLRDSLICLGSDITLLLVFIMESKVWYERAFIFMAGFFLLMFLSISFYYAAYLFIKIRSTAKSLHSLQTQLKHDYQGSRRRSTSLIIQKVGNLHLSDVIKIKYQTLRLIHRMTSPFLRIGFTEGDGESFSAESVASMISTVVCGSLMFLNTKYSSLKLVLTK